MHLDLFQRVHVGPASATIIDFHSYGAMLVKCNDTGGLADLLPELPADEGEEATA
jgi:hypothetical protein